MKFSKAVDIVGNEPVFETGLLLSGDINPSDLKRQLSRWKKSGHVYQLKRGVYTLAPPFRKINPHPFVVANRLARGSYVSLHSALAYYGHIPEYVAVVTSVTTLRPGIYNTPLGIYSFRHIKGSLFFGVSHVEVLKNQFAFVASAEKALFDILYLTPESESADYIEELRLQNLDQMDWGEFIKIVEKSGSLKLQKALKSLTQIFDRAVESS